MPSTPRRVSIFGLVIAWGGAAVFVASLSYFLFAYAVTFGETQPQRPTIGAIAWDVALFTVFALHHTVFARERVRAVMARTVPAALERSAYVWIASLLFIGVCALWRPVGGVVWSVSARIGWALYSVMAVGLWLSVRSATAIDVWELAGVRQAGNPKPDASRPVFKTTGPYGLVRHPIYLGWFLMVFGVPTMTATQLVFAVVSCVYLLMAIPFEERTLRRTTDGQYDAYMRAVRWRLMPGVY